MKKIILIFPLIVLISCEGNKVGKGIVYDKNSGVALDSVKYQSMEDGEIKYTDSLGNWEMNGPFGSCVPECQDFRVEFSKSGYKTLVKKNPDRNIYLETE